MHQTINPSCQTKLLKLLLTIDTVVWHFATVPGRRLPSCRRCSWAAAAFHSEPNMRCDADVQHLWRQSILGCHPALWNSLPSHLKDTGLSYNEFRRLLKTFLFGQWGHGAVWTLLTAPIRNICVDWKLFSQITQTRHCLHHLLPATTSMRYPYSLRKKTTLLPVTSSWICTV